MSPLWRQRLLLGLLYLTFLGVAVWIRVSDYPGIGFGALLVLLVLVRSRILHQLRFGTHLSGADQALARQLGFDEAILLELKRTAKAPLARLAGHLGAGHEEPLPGIAVDVPIDRAEGIIRQLKRSFLERGYVLFLTKFDLITVNDEPTQLAVLKTTDPYRVIETMGTNGVNYGIETADIVARLEQWAQEFSFELQVASFDTLQLRLVTLPKDPVAFAKEVFKFCPDAEALTEQTPAKFAADLVEDRLLVLWWD